MVTGIEPSRILLVEDDPYDIELIQLSFESYNFVNQLDIVTDGVQALDYLFGQGGNPPNYTLPRLVLLDLKLPRLSGIQVLERIRTHSRTRHLIVVVMTSSAEDRDLEACYNLGVNSYVVKPLDFQQFVDMSRRVGFYWMMLNQPPRL
jgi:CheY-like chemotaxis protein